MKNPLVLIIEDDRDLAELYADALQTMKFETEVVMDGKLALARLDEIVPQVVLLDLHLPDKSGTRSLRHTGIGILQQIRGDPRLRGTCIVVVTGDARAAEYLTDESDLTLIKPVTYEQLQCLVVRLAFLASRQVDTPSM